MSIKALVKRAQKAGVPDEKLTEVLRATLDAFEENSTFKHHCNVVSCMDTAIKNLHKNTEDYIQTFRDELNKLKNKK